MSRRRGREARLHARSAIGRPGKPEEVVTTALYLASPVSSYTTNALIRVDGGMYRTPSALGAHAVPSPHTCT